MRIVIFTILSIYIFSGCVPKIEKTNTINKTKIDSELKKDLQSFSSSKIVLQNNWWEIFGDKQLNFLVGNALENTPSLKVLKERYKRANSIVKIRKAGNLPTIGIGSDMSRQRFSENYIFPAPLGGNYYNLYQLDLNLSYDFDFWDRRASLIRASINEAMAQNLYIKVKELSVATSIVKLYLSLNFKNEELSKLDSLKKIILEKHHILNSLHELGIANKTEIHQSDASLEKIEQKIYDTKIEIDDLKSSLGIIAGLMPSDLDKFEKFNISNEYKVFVPKDIHLNVLSHRPEIAMQKYLLSSKEDYIQNAKSQFYPNISLTGLLNLTSFSWSSLFDKSSFAPLGGLAFSLPIFDSNRREENLNIKVSDYNAQVQDYNQSVIRAVNEVVTSLKKLELNKSKLEVQSNILENKKRNLEIEKRIYDLGLKNKISYLDSTMSFKEEEINSLVFKNQELNAQVDLIKALGGGYKQKVINVKHN